jgi:WD40 repeat protein
LILNGAGERNRTLVTGSINWLSRAKEGRTLASAGKEIKLWNLTTHREVGSFLPDSSLFVSFSPDGQRLLGGNIGEVHVWTASENALTR